MNSLSKAMSAPYLPVTSPTSISTSNIHRSYHEDQNHNDLIIDLGLSLGNSLQAPDDQAYHSSSGQFVNSADYGELMGWSHQLNPYMKASISNVYQTMVMLDDEETEVVQSKERWAYVKVNMEGIVIGRKICIHEHAGFTSLAIQLEDMFGRHSMFGLRLFDTESEFSLFYKDSTESWRTVGDVPWKEFVDCVTRLRINRKDGVIFSPSPSVSSLFT
ncbi:auxin-responsive protein IAA32-like [Papaver somniferum]|uniref:auxin-responsive protein IAA32-like n=1 Tax=Papaver somniferum TaxID=3469 RepID=UPI000E7052E3|nr:auxin-responsive protein IAA32-like [Papaver somniferum]